MSDLRDHLTRALESDLIGPFSLDPSSTEALPLPPSRWYLTGFLAPENAPPEDPATTDEEATAGDDVDADGATEDKDPRGPRILPCSLGLSILLPAAGADGHDGLAVTLRYASYRPEEQEPPAPATEAADKPAKKRRKKTRWIRHAAPAVTRTIPLDPSALERGVALAPDVVLMGHLSPAQSPGLEPGTRALSLFVVNRRPLPENARIDEACLFQVVFEVRPEAGLLPRPDPRGFRAHQGDDAEVHEDDRTADLQFRYAKEWAVGHGVSVEPIEDDAGKVVGARTTWLPRAVVPRVESHTVKDVELSMKALAAIAEDGGYTQALGGIAPAYGVWIAEEKARLLDGPAERAEMREVLLLRAEEARRRIAQGVALLEGDTGGELRRAFRLMNEAMALAAAKRAGEANPKWRLFQLAFVLLNLESLSNPASTHRKDVELIYFPTGGGKTEAYLGVIAFALVLRRLRGAARADGGLGVAVLLRYTLRLLTLDQLGRAATLICALETLRKREGATLGPERFSIGLWVGRSATANSIDQAADEITSYRLNRAASPCPLPTCPWCKTELDAGTLRAEPSGKPTRIVIGCKNDACDFCLAHDRNGLPMLFVDDQIYRELPSFLVATVDKFAMLPWRGRTAMFFGHATARLGMDHFGAMDERVPKGAQRLPDGLLPPELIVQDELHLISGPLGTMVGLYETGIDQLTTRTISGTTYTTKILASTATVRRAEEQVRALFGRRRMHVFPPAGMDDGETFFSKVDRVSPGRLYVGVAAPGRAMKAVLIRTYVALLGVGRRIFDAPNVDRETADAYMTLVGYFNSLRELGGMRRLLEDEIRSRLALDANERAPLDWEGAHPWAARRHIKYEPVELTSRESTASIAAAKDKLGKKHPCDEQIDVALASNMISVGLDIDRLGLMVIAGQPKTTSEYIQASSRVGRSVKRPGLVVTIFNLFKARDRSHYERFRAYHESFYRFVEAGSVTPFSAPALDRGLAAVLVAMTRLGDDALTPPGSVGSVDAMRPVAERAVRAIAEKAAFEKKGRSESDAVRVRDNVTTLGRNLIEAWAKTVTTADASDRAVRYSDLESGKGEPLLFTALDVKQPAASTPHGKFRALTSMRDVEPSVHLWKESRLKPQDGGGSDGE